MTDPSGGKSNIVLIGMPGCGKSTVGILLAKVLSAHFMDTDVYIQGREGRRLQEIIERTSLDRFRELEETYVLSLNCTGHVIATGGSVVYGTAAMRWLKAHGIVVYLEVSPERLEQRLTDIATRGIARRPGQSLVDLWRERDPLYRRFADVVVRCGAMDHTAVVGAIQAALTTFRKDRTGESPPRA